jgi:hypothetical protein
VKPIRIPQHFYASAPHGMTGRAGLQTVAVSRELADEKIYLPLEAHCRFSMLEDCDEKEFPVNWGWFHLKDGRGACLHRIGYSGTDDKGRPGNFMAHNLIVGVDDLEAIDYDIVALLEWVRTESPTKYRYAAKEIEDGFVRRHNQLYKTYGEQQEALSAIPPLEVSVSDIRAMRKKLDSQWEAELLPALQKRFGPDRFTELANSVLRASGDAQPTVIVGLQDGKNDSALELSICQALFAIFPAHIRKRLTFSTYHEEPYDAAQAVHMPDDEVPAHARLRLAMSPAPLGRPRGGATPAALYVFDTKGASLETLPSLNGAVALRQYGHWLSDAAGRKAIVALRNSASHFEWADEVAGLDKALEYYRLGEAPRSKQEYDTFHSSVSALRRPSPDLVNRCHAWINQAAQQLGSDRERMARLAHDYTAIVAGPGSNASGDLFVAQLDLALVAGYLQRLFEWALQLLSVEMIDRLLWLVCLPEFPPQYRSEALKRYAAALPKLGTANVDTLLKIWEVVSSRQQPAEIVAFQGKVAAGLADKVLQELSGPKGGRVDERVLSLLAQAPINDPANLARVLRLVLRSCLNLSPAEARQMVSQFVERVLAGGRVPPEWIVETLRDRPLAFALSSCWPVLAERKPELEPLVRTHYPALSLLNEYWQGDVELWSPLWHATAIAIASGKPELPPQAIEPFALLYGDEGAEELGKQVQLHLHNLSLEAMQRVVAGHLAVMKLALMYPPFLADRSRHQALARHLIELCAAQATRAVSGAREPWQWSADRSVMLVAMSLLPVESFLMRLGSEADSRSAAEQRAAAGEHSQLLRRHGPLRPRCRLASHLVLPVDRSGMR